MCTLENSATQKLSILLLLILSFQQTIIIYPSSHLLFYIIHRFTFLSIYQFHFFFSIWIHMHTYLSTHLLVCVPPENECTLLANHEDPPIESTNRLHVHRCTCSQNLPIHFYASIPNNLYDLTIHPAIALHIYRTTQL